jgi:hypothetical protein
MARYSDFLGRRVEVHYRAGDILLPASGTFVADSGRSIFLEQHLLQHGQQKQFRWEIPYQYIVSLEEKPDEAVSTKVETPVPPAVTAGASPQSATSATARSASRTPERISALDPALVPLRNRPKPA